MNLLLREYLLSGEVSEAERCLRALEVPHFHHELVYEVRGWGGWGCRGCSTALLDARCPQAVVMVLEGSGDAPVTMMVTLLKVLWETGLVTLDQMNRVSVEATIGGAGGCGAGVPGLTPAVSPRPQGFQRVYAELGDISLDVPLAHGLLERLVELCFQRGIITRALRDACPARYGDTGGGGGGAAGPSSPHPLLILILLLRRGRKRFVSEGDGGQVKQ